MMAIVACGMSANDHRVERFVTNLMEQYPAARLLDIYKSCFQDYMGAEHLVGDTASARAYLEQEIETTNAEDLMPWYYEPCGANGNYVRVNLRCVIEGILPADTLLDAFIASANTPQRPSVTEWAQRWHAIVDQIDQMALDLPNYDQDKQFIEEVLALGKYAISHSPEYREAYAPHYRIVERGIFDERIRGLLPGSH